MTFDAAGNVKGYTTSNDPYMHYDAASQLFTQFESGGSSLVTVRENYQDGDGAKVFYKTSTGSLINGSYSLFCNYFLIRSSVLGGKVLAEFKDLTTLAANDPLKYYSKSYVYLKGVQLGFQENAHKVTGDKHVTWTYHNPTVGNYFAEHQLNNNSSSSQQVNYPDGEMTFDPLGSYVGISQPPQPLDVPAPFTFVSGQYMEPSGKCYADYVETPCTIAQKMLNNGTGQHAPWDPTATVYNPITKKNELAVFTTDWDNGFFGFVPTGANYNGDGGWTWRTSTGRPTLNPRGTYESRHGRGFSPEPEPQSTMKKHIHNFVPWVIRKVDKLKNYIENENKQGRDVKKWTDGNGTTNCASLPMKWDFDNSRPIEQMRHPERGTWQMGTALTPLTVLGLTRGTVIATFDRSSGVYLNRSSGNHTAIFLSAYGETDRSGKFTATGIWVIEQGPRWPTRGNQIPFDSTASYYADAGRFNVVKICESHNPKLPFE